MPDEKEIQSGRRLAEDLRRLREERDVTIEALHEETKIPLGLIESFEEDALFGHQMFNKVYLRSFVRTYAQVVGLDVGPVTQALEAALTGDYNHQLREASAEADTEEQQVAAEPDDAQSEAADEGDAAERASASTAAPEGASDVEDTGARAKRPAEDEAVGDADDAEDTEPAPAAPEKRAEQPATPPEDDRGSEEEGAAAAAASPTATSPPGAAPQESETSRRQPSRSRSRTSGSSAPTWVFAVGGLIVVALLAWLFISVFTGEGTGEAAQESTAADTTEAAAPADTVQQEPAFEPVTIGDSIDVEVLAADGPIRELRVRPDNQTRRPYWIEEGQSMSFSAANRITFSPPQEATNERPMDVMRLLVEGREYPTGERNAQGQLVITRDRAQTVLDSLARQR